MGINPILCRGVILSYSCNISWTESGTLVVTCLALERLSAATVAVNADEEVSMIEVTMRTGSILSPHPMLSWC
jgi:hypothetical protein